MGPLGVGAGINITVWSYVDQLNISVLADDLTLSDPHEATGAMQNLVLNRMRERLTVKARRLARAASTLPS